MNTNKFGLPRIPDKGVEISEADFDKIKDTHIDELPPTIGISSVFRTFRKTELSELSEKLINKHRSLLVYLGVYTDGRLILIFEEVNEILAKNMNATGSVAPPQVYRDNKQMMPINKIEVSKAFNDLKNTYSPTKTKLQGFVWGNIALQNVVNEMGGEETLEIRVGWNGKGFEFYAIPSKGGRFYKGIQNQSTDPLNLGIPPVNPEP